MDIESAFPPHAVASIFTRYEHNGNCVRLTNENIKCGSSATIDQLKQRDEQHCYKSAPRAMRHLYQEMPRHIRRWRRMRGYPTKYSSLISYEWIDTIISLDDLFFYAQQAFNFIKKMYHVFLILKVIFWPSVKMQMK